MSDHEPYLQQTLQLADQAVKNGNHPFGALLVHQGRIILTAENCVITDNDITAHAELNLVRRAAQQFPPQVLKETTLYTSTEPCAMCAGAIFWAGIPMVVFACSNWAFGEFLSNETNFLTGKAVDILAGGRRPTMIVGPILEEEALQQHRLFWPNHSLEES